MIECRSDVDRKNFYEWHAAEKAACGEMLSFWCQIAAYCFNEVTGMVKYAKMFCDHFTALI